MLKKAAEGHKIKLEGSLLINTGLFGVLLQLLRLKIAF